MKQIEEIYNRYFHDVFLYLKSISGNEHIAEELTQETFFRAMKSAESFRGDCDVRVWLCQIAKNAYFSYCKKSGRFTGEEIPETVSDPSVSLELSVEDSQQSMQIHRILHNMEEPHKEVFTLKVFGELSFRQIGELFGKSESWARVTFHRAKLKIIDKLEELK